MQSAFGRRQEPIGNVRNRLVTLQSVSSPLARRRAAWFIRWGHEDTCHQTNPEEDGALCMLPVSTSDGPGRGTDHDQHDGRPLADEGERGVPPATGLCHGFMRLNSGDAVLKDVAFNDGTIEFDVNTIGRAHPE